MKVDLQSGNPAAPEGGNEEALRTSELRYRRLFESAKDGILILDADTGMVVDVNPFLIALLGYSREQFLEKAIWELGFFKDIVANKASFEELRETKYIRYADKPLEAADGRRINVEFVSNVYLVNGERVIQCNIRDISVRKNAEDELRSEKALFTSLCDAIPDNIYFKDRQSRFVRVNEAMARQFGFGRATEVAGKTDLDIFSGEHARQAYADEQRMMETGVPMIGVEEKETWPDGRVSWVSTTKMPLRDAQGRITGLVGISRDVTGRKLADDRIREQNEILSNSQEGVMIVNLCNEVSLWNHGAEEMFGWTEAEALGRTPQELLGVTDLGVVSELRTAVDQVGYWRGELRSKTRDGRELTLDSRITLVRDAAGQPRARLNFFSDISATKLLEERFLHAQRLEGIGMLAAGIAHDLNNVLSPIMFAAPLLRGSLSAPADLKILATLEQSAARGAGLVKQILGFAHRTSGGFRPTQVSHLLQDIVNLMEQTFPKSIRLESNLPPDLWQVLGDATQIHQVLLNLCVNARDAMPDGGRLGVFASNRRLDAAESDAIPGASPGAWCVFEVRDTGAGISQEVEKHIWDPFFTTKGEGRGTGLGLSTVRGIVASHNGFIDLHTEVGRGTTFRVFLPAVETGSSLSATPPEVDEPDGNGERVLVADDDEAIRDTVTAILERHSYHVDSCKDGMDAIDSFTARPDEISLVITDVDMPRLGGVGLVRALKRIRPGIPMLAISGLSRRDSEGSDIPEVRGLTQAFLIKPFSAGDLLRAMHSLLHPNGDPGGTLRAR